ncbi:hypothetical protein GX48_00307 [Paracoccidioides brasiliensis]|nr:hypothetical protein GX48_00307 [Paracoccidioides brasiliensis]
MIEHVQKAPRGDPGSCMGHHKTIHAFLNPLAKGNEDVKDGGVSTVLRASAGPIKHCELPQQETFCLPKSYSEGAEAIMENNSQRLLDYLGEAPPGFPTNSTTKTPNTTNDQYSWRQINSVGQWSEFIYVRIIQRYGTLLHQVRVVREPIPYSPPQPINTELMFAVRFASYVQGRLRHALRAGLQNPAPQLANMNLTPITVDTGDASQITNRLRPDISFFRAGSTPSSSPNRCPGCLKVSRKWRSDWGKASSHSDRTEYLQVLSQVNFYMKQLNTRYGFVLTDAELVPIKRLDDDGSLLVAQAIPWETEGPGRLTILLGLWYLGMLVAADNEWQFS